MYEGHSAAEVAFPARVLVALGAQALIVTNAAGGLDPTWPPGTLMLIRDHIDLLRDHALRGPNDDRLGPRFPDMTRAYRARAARARARGRRARPASRSHEGVYAAMPGPTYETPAEVGCCSILGADATGMSTVPEVVVARHMGARVLGISCITNQAAGITGERAVARRGHRDRRRACATSSRRCSTAILARLGRERGSCRDEPTAIDELIAPRDRRAAARLRAVLALPGRLPRSAPAARSSTAPTSRTRRTAWPCAPSATRWPRAVLAGAPQARRGRGRAPTRSPPVVAVRHRAARCSDRVRRRSGARCASSRSTRAASGASWTLAELLPARLPPRPAERPPRDEPHGRGDLPRRHDPDDRSPARRVLAGDVACRRRRRSSRSAARTRPRGRDYRSSTATGCVVMPGLVQAHVHMCQTLARGRADDLELLDWLRKVVWPYEAALDADAVAAPAPARLRRAAARRHDRDPRHGHGPPHRRAVRGRARHRPARDDRQGDDGRARPQSRRACARRRRTRSTSRARLSRAGTARAGGRLRYAYAPRFVLSCTDELLREVGSQARARRRADPHPREREPRRGRRGAQARSARTTSSYLAPSSACSATHVVPRPLRPPDRRTSARLLREHRHPRRALPVVEPQARLRHRAVPELHRRRRVGRARRRRRAVQQQPRRLPRAAAGRRCSTSHGRGPRALPAPEVVAGDHGRRRRARARRSDRLARGRQARRRHRGQRRRPAHRADREPLRAIAYAARASDVRHVAVDGQVVVRDRTLLTLDVDAVRTRARAAARRLFA